jgi:hypothetical protein
MHEIIKVKVKVERKKASLKIQHYIAVSFDPISLNAVHLDVVHFVLLKYYTPNAKLQQRLVWWTPKHLVSCAGKYFEICQCKSIFFLYRTRPVYLF